MTGLTSHRQAALCPAHRFTRVVRVLLLLSSAAVTSCTSDPGQDLGKNTLSDVVARESGGALAVATFTKANGIKRQVSGQAIYTLEYSSILKFTRNGWKGGNAFEGQFSDFGVATAQPVGFGAFGKEWNYFDAGDQVEITGDITYESTGKGWRPTGHNVKSYRIVSRKQDQVFAKLVGKWTSPRPGMPDNVEFVRDRKGVKFIGADGQVLAEDDVYLHYCGGKLYGTYQMGRHGGAHGMLFPMNFSLELRDDGTLLFDDSRSKTVYKMAS